MSLFAFLELHEGGGRVVLTDGEDELISANGYIDSETNSYHLDPHDSDGGFLLAQILETFGLKFQAEA